MNQTIRILLIIGLIGVLVVASYYIFVKGKIDNLIEIGGMYDANRNLIKEGLSVVEGQEGVKYITLKITVNNKDTVSLNFIVDNLTPIEISPAKPTNKLSLEAGKSGSWITGLIDIEPYEGTTQNFCVKVSSEKIPALREVSQIGGCVGVIINPNPAGTFDISVSSQIGDGSINPGCNESWQCTSYGSCSNGIQTRTCTDLNNCGTTIDKPVEQQTCALITECNAANVGIRKCYSSTKYQTCLASGSWSGILSCSNACTGQGVCS